MVDESVSVRASRKSLHIDDLQAERQNNKAAFCAATETHLAGVTDRAGA